MDLKTKLQTGLPPFWQRRGWLNYALLPLSGLFYGLSQLQRALYGLGIKTSVRVACPVICVGNINVGGSGKTPLVLALAEHLQQQGHRVGVISRGYQGRYQATQPVHVVEPDDTADWVGDEPLLFKQRLDCPVVVARKRALAAQQLLKQFPETDYILCDDGLQHWGLHKTLSIAVVHRDYQFGNGFLLPAGPLREPVTLLKHYDFVVYNGGLENDLANHLANADDLTNHLANGQHQILSPYCYELQPRAWVSLKNPLETRPLDAFIACKATTPSDLIRGESKALQIISGIAHPQYFFAQCRTLGIVAMEKAFPDHHRFTTADLTAGLGVNTTLLMTEKDAVKIKPLLRAEPNQSIEAWYLHSEAVLSPQLVQDFSAKLAEQQKPDL